MPAVSGLLKKSELQSLLGVAQLTLHFAIIWIKKHFYPN